MERKVMTYGWLAFRRIYDQITTSRVWSKKFGEKKTREKKLRYTSLIISVFHSTLHYDSIYNLVKLWTIATFSIHPPEKKERKQVDPRGNTVRWFHLVPILSTIPLSRTRPASAFYRLRWAPFEIFTRSRADLFNEFDAPLSRIPRALQSAEHSYELARKMKVYSMARDFFFTPMLGTVYRARFLSLKREWISGVVFRDARAQKKKKKSAFKFSARFERTALCDRRSAHTTRARFQHLWKYDSDRALQ